MSRPRHSLWMACACMSQIIFRLDHQISEGLESGIRMSELTPGAPGLTIFGNTITYDSGDAALGAWGATISATLVAADTLGHTLTHTWSFRLEPEPLVAANIFVFGSPTAQRAGQRVSGPAAALAARFPAPVGPQRVRRASAVEYSRGAGRPRGDRLRGGQCSSLCRRAVDL